MYSRAMYIDFLRQYAHDFWLCWKMDKHEGDLRYYTSQMMILQEKIINHPRQ